MNMKVQAHAETDEVENGNTVERDGVDEADGGGDEVEMDEDDEDGEENDGRRRYDLRNRAEVRRSSPEKENEHIIEYCIAEWAPKPVGMWERRNSSSQEASFSS
ncbi:hypothetical protein HPP92_008992 [Vanilla planifolia]|uniref:Uncharacterized protein n=1 Tax=Vanilla planifolia TaxID=51239 RepID=A0A835V507_VANPL|nr:hypothetical protein HPP92_008992 [Vanilla planifolia]